jgi:hypothetical protein
MDKESNNAYYKQKLSLIALLPAAQAGYSFFYYFHIVLQKKNNLIEEWILICLTTIHKM